jgi:dinuclear metal center YbgI/SA1388 family protein
MKIKEIVAYLESKAPLALQEDYDNAGLITGNGEWQCTGALLCLDSIEAVVDEANALGANMIIAHHPIVFTGMKSLTGRTYVERTIINAIKNDIAIYAIHTNLDNVWDGVNARIADKLGLTSRAILGPLSNQIRKIVVYVPHVHLDSVREAMFEAGAGNIGEYSECGFVLSGEGTFKAGKGTDPHVGEIGSRHREAESRLEMAAPSHKVNAVIRALLEAHPYEEVAYDIIPVEGVNPRLGAGMVGEMDSGMDLKAFLKHVKSTFHCQMIRFTADIGVKVKRVAVCGGSGRFLLKDAIRAGADVFLTSDFKYHEFFDAEGKIVVVDIGHFESEQFTVDLLGEMLKEKFPNFALHFTRVKTNPVNYF